MTQAEVSLIDGTSQQRHAAEVGRIVENSFAFKARQLMHGVTLHVFESTPKELAAELNSLNDSRQALREKCDEAVVAVRDAVQMQSGEMENFDAVVDALKLKKLPLLKSIAQWYVDALDAMSRHVAALRPIPEQLHLESEKIVEQVKADLERIGSGIYSMPGYRHDAPDAAVHQFDFVSRHNLRSACAIQAEQQATIDLNVVVETKNRIPDRLAEVRKMLAKVAVQAVSSAV